MEEKDEQELKAKHESFELNTMKSQVLFFGSLFIFLNTVVLEKLRLIFSYSKFWRRSWNFGCCNTNLTNDILHIIGRHFWEDLIPVWNKEKNQEIYNLSHKRKWLQNIMSRTSVNLHIKERKVKDGINPTLHVQIMIRFEAPATGNVLR